MKKSLGKGLGALLSDFEDFNTDNSKNDINKNIPNNINNLEINLNLIDTNPNQPRKNFDKFNLMELTNSIRIHGVLSPIIVTKKNNRYMIIAGERRYKAAINAGLTSIPAIIKDLTDFQIKEIALIENIQREDLNQIELALGIKELMNKHNYTQDDIAQRLGKSRSSISNTLRLLNLCNEVQNLIKENKLSAGHAKCLIVVTDEKLQLQLATKAINENISVHDFEKLVKNNDKINSSQKTIKQSIPLELNNFIQNLQRLFATKVSISGNEKKGKIIIDYFTKDDLDRIYNIMQHNNVPRGTL